MSAENDHLGSGYGVLVVLFLSVFPHGIEYPKLIAPIRRAGPHSNEARYLKSATLIKLGEMPVLKTFIDRRREMQKYKYKYQVDEPKFDEWAFDLECADWDSDLEYVAEEAADDYHSNHDGWEAHWPCDFYIFDLDGKLLGVFTVQREAEPVFSATEKKNAPQNTKEQNGHISQQANYAMSKPTA